MIEWAKAWIRARWRKSKARPPVAEPVLTDERQCGRCRHFRHDPGEVDGGIVEDIFGEDVPMPRPGYGLCLFHDRFVTATSLCVQFTERMNRSRATGSSRPR